MLIWTDIQQTEIKNGHILRVLATDGGRNYYYKAYAVNDISKVNGNTVVKGKPFQVCWGSPYCFCYLGKNLGLICSTQDEYSQNDKKLRIGIMQKNLKSLVVDKEYTLSPRVGTVSKYMTSEQRH